jgi:hypothetical protein
VIQWAIGWINKIKVTVRMITAEGFQGERIKDIFEIFI